MSDDHEEKARHFLARTHAHVARVKRNARALVESMFRIDGTLVPSGFRVDGKAFLAQVATHDDSKFLPPERDAYVEITWSYRCKRLGEHFELSDELRQAMNVATLHHVKANRHHPEFWAPSASINLKDRDAPPAELVDGTGMDDVSLVEMCCDWVSMSQEKLDHNSAHSWARDNVNVRWSFSGSQERRIYEVLRALQTALDMADCVTADP